MIITLCTTLLLGTSLALASFLLLRRKKITQDQSTAQPTTDLSRVEQSPTVTVPGLEPSTPGMGNILDIASAGSYFAFLTKLHKEFGPIAKFWYGQKLMVSLASPELFHKTSKAGNRPPEMFEVFSPLMAKESLAFTNGAEGRRRRAAYDRPLSHLAMSNYFPGTNKVARRWVEEWQALEHKYNVSVKDYALRYAMEAILQQLYGDYFTTKELVIRMQTNFDFCWHELERRARGDLAPPESDRAKELTRRRDEIYSDIGGLITHRRQNPPEPGDEKLIDLVLEYGEENERLIETELVNYIIGAYMSTGDILTWLLYFLATHKDVQEKLYTDLVDLVGEEALSFEAMQHYPYMKQVLDETLRASLLGTFVARSADTDMTLDGHHIPAGTSLIQAIGVVHLDEKYYPDPLTFDPDRFSEDNKDKRPPNAFVPFGFAGGRKCPGSRFAYVICTIILTHLIRNFRIRYSPNQAEVEIVHGLLSFLKGEILIDIEERNPAA